jgi:hypothetical protein
VRDGYRKKVLYSPMVHYSALYNYTVLSQQHGTTLVKITR